MIDPCYVSRTIGRIFSGEAEGHPMTIRHTTPNTISDWPIPGAMEHLCPWKSHGETDG